MILCHIHVVAYGYHTEILLHLGCKKPCKKWDKPPTSTGDRWISEPSTVSLSKVHLPSSWDCLEAQAHYVFQEDSLPWDFPPVSRLRRYLILLRLLYQLMILVGHFRSVSYKSSTFIREGWIPCSFCEGFSGAYTRVPWRFCNCSTAEIILRPSRTTLEYLWILAALYVKWQFHTSIILTVLSYGSKTLSKVSSLLCFLPTRAIQLPWSIISQQKTCHESWVINMSWVIRIYYILCIICIFIYITYHIFSCIISSSYNPKNKIIPFASHHSPFSRFQSCLRWLLQFWK